MFKLKIYVYDDECIIFYRVKFISPTDVGGECDFKSYLIF